MTEAQRQRHRDTCRKASAQRYAQRAQDNLCRQCGALPATGRKFCKKCLKRKSKTASAYFKRNAARLALRRQELRLAVLQKYGGRCSCNGCEESRVEFLGIDHINGDGHSERRDKKHTGTRWYVLLLSKPLRSDLRILCHNCNLARGFYGYCPHEKERNASKGQE